MADKIQDYIETDQERENGDIRIPVDETSNAITLTNASGVTWASMSKDNRNRFKLQPRMIDSAD